MARFRDRRDAGDRLAERLSSYAGTDAVVLGLPRGGVPVAAAVAEALGLPLDVFVVRKLGVPGHEELAMGALASGGVQVINDDVVRDLRIGTETIDAVARIEAAELERRERSYRGGRPPIDVRSASVLLIDDGLATGATMRAAVRAVRARGAQHICVAVPIGAQQTCEDLTAEADAVVCAVAPELFSSVGNWYEDFAQTTDEEVRDLLGRAAARRAA